MISLLPKRFRSFAEGSVPPPKKPTNFFCFDFKGFAFSSAWTGSLGHAGTHQLSQLQAPAAAAAAAAEISLHYRTVAPPELIGGVYPPITFILCYWI